MSNAISILRGLGLVAGLVACAAVICVLYVYVSEGSHMDEQLAECRLMWRSGDVVGARQRLLKLHSQYETHVGPIETLADLEAGVGNVEQAIGWLRRVPESSPKRAATARHKAAQMAMQIGRARDTESLALDSLRLDPQLSEPRRLLMRYYFLLLQHPQMIEQSVALDQSGQLLLVDLLMRCITHRASWDDDEHVAWLEKCLIADPADAVVRAALARNYSARDRNDEAWRTLNAAPPGSRDEWRIALARAEQEIIEGRIAAASQTLDGLREPSEAECRLWLARARVWMETGREDAARIALENVARLDPYDPTPSYLLSRLVAAEGAEREANTYFQRSQQLKELMGLVSRLMEAANPSYHPFEPVAITLQRTQQAFLELGFQREAEIVGTAMRGGESQVPSSPLDMARAGDIASPPTKPGRETIAPAVNSPATQRSAKPEGEIGFEDVSSQIGLSFHYDTGNSPYRWLMETLGGGVAVLDYDLDGWDDIHLVQAGPLPVQPGQGNYNDRLFRNLRGEAVVDVTNKAMLSDHAYGHGTAVGDYDNDGFPDLLVCNYGELLIYHNEGDGTFTNTGKATGIASTGWSTSAIFSDLDRDGDSDLYVVQYVDAPYASHRPCMHQGEYTSCRPFVFSGQPDLFWENLGDGRFADRTAEFGLTAPDGKGLGVAVADFNRSGNDAIFVANDTSPNFLFTSAPAPTGRRFREMAAINGIAVNGEGLTEACMGVGLGDVNDDGRFDLLVTTFQGETNTLFLGMEHGGFADETERAGLAASSRNRMGWGCHFFDVDCNRDLDLFVANGHLHTPPQLAQFYYNVGGGRFTEISEVAGPYFRQPWLGRSVALIDWNRDLLTDVLVTYQQENTSLLQNTSIAGNRLQLALTGTESNRDAVGALIEATIGDRTCHFAVTRGGGYLAANDPKVLVGCGTATRVDQLRIRWPSGRVSTFRDVPVGKAYLVHEDLEALLVRSD